MENLIKKHLLKINNELINVIPDSDDLMGGKAGIMLYKYQYLKHILHHELDEVNFQNGIQLLAESNISDDFIAFSNGKSGLNWFFSYLSEDGIIDDEDLEDICYDNDELAESALTMLKNDNYDFLYGAIGVALQLLFKSNGNYDKFFKVFFTLLTNLKNKSKDNVSIPSYDYRNQKCIDTEINVSLSHGIPSILKFCLQCYKKGILADEAKLMAENIIDFLLSNVNKDKSQSYFPGIIDLTKTSDSPSRLAWCYGDLGLAYILLQAGFIFHDQRIINFSLEVLHNCTKRHNLLSTLVYDAGICHGSAGVSHLYNKVWFTTKEKVFKRECDFWMRRTLDFSVHNDTVSGYKSYDPVKKSFVASNGLLEGISGVGLVLLSYISGDFSWDYCLMLNSYD